jgi:rod shape-determining protein MreC
LEKKTGIVIGACALAGVAVGLWVAGGFAVAAEAVYPLEKSATWFQRNVSCRLRTLWRRQNYAVENARLRRENDMLRMALQELSVEQPAARESINPQLSTHWIPAPVLSRGGITGAKNFLRIGRGSAHGVRKGAAVAVPDGLVGIVSEVSPHTCTVKFISDPEVKVSCEIEIGDAKAGAVYGIVSGTGTTEAAQTDVTVLYVVNPLRVGHLKSGFAPPPRSRVVTSGLGGVFPKGIVIGYLVSETREDESKLEREGDIAPAVDFPALEEVFIHRED